MKVKITKVYIAAFFTQFLSVLPSFFWQLLIYASVVLHKRLLLSKLSLSICIVSCQTEKALNDTSCLLLTQYKTHALCRYKLALKFFCNAKL